MIGMLVTGDCILAFELTSQVKPKKTLVFACFAAEEPGLRGSEELFFFSNILTADEHPHIYIYITT